MDKRPPRNENELLNLAFIRTQQAFNRSINMKFTVITVLIIIGLISNIYRAYSGGEKLAVIQEELRECKMGSIPASYLGDK